VIEGFLDFVPLSAIYFALLGGFLFGIYVIYKSDVESSWHDIAGWGIAVYLTLFLLAEVNSFLSGEERWLEMFARGFSRWFSFILAILVTAGIIRYVHKWYVNRKRDDDLR
jgi:hypothetical protein